MPLPSAAASAASCCCWLHACRLPQAEASICQAGNQPFSAGPLNQATAQLANCTVLPLTSLPCSPCASPRTPAVTTAPNRGPCTCASAPSHPIATPTRCSRTSPSNAASAARKSNPGACTRGPAHPSKSSISARPKASCSPCAAASPGSRPSCRSALARWQAAGCCVAQNSCPGLCRLHLCRRKQLLRRAPVRRRSAVTAHQAVISLQHSWPALISLLVMTMPGAQRHSRQLKCRSHGRH